MNRNLSSAWTFFHKYLFPALWIPGFGIATVTFFRHPEDVAYNGVAGAAPAGMRWLFLLFWVAGAAFILWFAIPLKLVRVDGGALVVSNFLREWRVPFSLIADVRQNRWINVRPITIRLRADVGFGARIVLMPPVRFRLRFWREDPEVDELRRVIGLGTTLG